MISKNEVPDFNFKGLIDQDILERFNYPPAFYGDIINAQLVKTNKELLEAIRLLHGPMEIYAKNNS